MMSGPPLPCCESQDSTRTTHTQTKDGGTLDARVPLLLPMVSFALLGARSGP